MTMTLSVASQEDEREAACYANSFRQARFKRLLAVVDDAKTGDTLRMKVIREHKSIELKLHLEKRAQ